MTQPLIDLGYPTEAHGRIPAFHSVEEEAEFWDTHDITDFLDDLEPVKLRVSPWLASVERITIGLGREDREELERLAAEQGVDGVTLVQRWVEDHLRGEAEPEASPR